MHKSLIKHLFIFLIIFISIDIFLFSEIITHKYPRYEHSKFLSTYQKKRLYKISEMIYENYPVNKITNLWIKTMKDGKRINIQKSANYIYRRLRERILSDADIIRYRIRKLNLLKKNLKFQVNENNTLTLFNKIELPIQDKIENIDKEIKYETKKLNSIFYRNKQILKKLDKFLEQFRLSSRPIWKFMRYLSPKYYIKSPWKNYLRKDE